MKADGVYPRRYRSGLLVAIMMLLTGVFAPEILAATGGKLFDKNRPLTYSLPDVSSMTRDRYGVNPSVIAKAAAMMAEDIEMVSGMAPLQVTSDEAGVVVIDLAVADTVLLDELKHSVPSVEAVSRRRDAFVLKVVGDRLYAVGSDHRGTAYAILELSRMAGVSPWIWWGDSRPIARESMTLPDGYETMQAPAVEYRGVFLNDEDWTLRPWSRLTLDAGLPPGTIGPRTYEQVFRLLLRLRANALWPAMHEGTVAFFNVEGAGDLADSYGIALGSSHCEPLLRNNVGEWDVGKRGRYNFITNRDAVIDYWRERLSSVGQGDNMLTLGMRGIHDGSMEGVRTMDEKLAALQDVIDAQRRLIGETTGRELATVPQVFIPYKEVLDIMDRGLRVPDDVTLMWCDDNYGYLTRLSDSIQESRSGGAGIYYHLSYWGRPHDYLWLSTTQPGLICHEMHTAYQRGAKRIWIVNVHDPKITAYQLELFLDLAWNVDSVVASGADRHLRRWLEREYGCEVAGQLSEAMMEFYRLTAMRRPEHLGWTQVELSDRRAYPRGRSQVRDTEFSFDEFGGEARRYLRDYARVAAAVSDLVDKVPPERRDSYFATVVYPVLGAEAMARKHLFAQLSRSHAIGNGDNDLTLRDSLMTTAAAASLRAYRDIDALTAYYNDSLAGGKWHGLMRNNPRDLYVFYPPLIPVLPPDGASGLSPGELAPDSLVADGWVACDACRFSSATFTPHPVALLGHSGNALPLPRGESVSYTLPLAPGSEARLVTCLVPTHPVDNGSIRIEISVDGDTPQVIDFREKGRTDRWKENVLRNQARIVTNHNLAERDIHTVTVRALDDHVVLDQLMLDTDLRRNHYTIPTKP